MLPGWSDTEILECDLSRLRMAIEAAVKRLDEDRLHAEMIHGVKRKDDYQPPRNAMEQDERVAATFAALGTVKVERPVE